MLKKLLITVAGLSCFLVSINNVYACRKDLNVRDIFAELGDACNFTGDPVNPVNGNMFYERSDYIINSTAPIEVKRYYNSQLPVLKHQPFGKGWSSIFNIHLSIEKKGSERQQLCLHDIDGKTICFNEYKPLMLGADPIELWSSKENTRLSLLRSPSGYTLKLLDNSSYVFDTKGLLLQHIHSDGHTHQFTYPDDKIIVTDAFGYKLMAQTDGNRLVTDVELPDGHRITYGYNDQQLVSVDYPNGSSIRYTYDDSGNLSGVYDGQNKPVSMWEYDHKHRVTYNRQLREAGYEDAIFTFCYKNHLTDSYWNFYFKTLVGLPRGGAQEYDFASHKETNYPIEYSIKQFDRGQLIEQKHLEHKHDCHVYPKEVKSEINTITDYDEKGLLRHKKIALGSTVYEEAHYQWNQYRLPEEVKYRDGLTIKFSYDSKQRPERISSSDGQSERVWQYSYDDKGFLRTVQAPNNVGHPDAVIQYQYNNKGQLASITNELGHQVTYDQYDASGHLSSWTNENGVRTQYEYDALGLPIAIKTNNTGKIQLNYDHNNAISKVVSAEGITTYYDFNYWRDLRSVKDEQGNRYVQKIDPMGHVTSQLIYDHTGKLVYKKTYEYDSFGRLHHQGDADGNDIQSYFYKEKQLQPVSSVDRKGVTHRYTYDGERLTGVDKVSPENKKLNYLNVSYDVLGYIKSVNTLSHRSSYVRNAWGEVISIKRHEKEEEKYIYNAQGQLKTYQDGKEQAFNYQYDVLNRITEIDVISKDEQNHQTGVRYFYDQGNHAIGRLNRVERLTSSAPVSAIENSYDAVGNISAQRYIIDHQEYQIAYHYNKDHQITSMTYPSGLTIHYHYSRLGKVNRITTDNDFASIASDIDYMPFGSVKSLIYGNQLKLTRDYDLSYRLTKQQVGEIKDDYGYDALGNITHITHRQLPEESKTYTYDLLNRITSMQSATENQSFVYDDSYYSNSMREKTSSINGKLQLSQYHDKLNSYTDDKSHGVKYDNNGNVIELGEMTLNYDSFNNLTKVTKAEQIIAEYRYSPLNKRVIKVVDGKKTIFIYDQFGKLIEIITPHSITDIIYLDDQPIAQIVNGSTYYFVNNATSTPMYLLDHQGRESWRANVKPFEIDTYGIVEQNLRFPGQYYDEETGFYYNNARYYHPKLAQYLQAEPLDVLSDGSFYPYAYADYNPVNRVDITGENPFLVAGAVVVAGIVKAVWKPIVNAFNKGKKGAGNTKEAAKKAEAVREAPKEVSKQTGACNTGYLCSGAENAATYPKLKNQLQSESAGSPFTSTGELTKSTLNNSERIFRSSEIKNPNIPKGYGKYETKTFQSPSGNFKVHYYKHDITGKPYYGHDYKVVFNSMSGAH